MAVVANTYLRSAADGKQNRETIISDVIDVIDPTETPLYSMIDKVSVDGVKAEWVTSSLATPSITNNQLEGQTYTFSAVNQPARVLNYTQISWKTYIISKTQEAVSKVGKQSEIGRSRSEKGLELRTDIEATMLSNNASLGGETRTSAGLRAWTATNDLMGTNGISGGYSAGIVAAATDGDQRAFTKALMDAALLAAYNAGGKPTVCILSPYNKSVFSQFMSDANVVALRLQADARKEATLIGAVGAYLSDWGLVDFVPNRQMARYGAGLARNVFFITPDKLAKGFLRPIAEAKDVAQISDADARVLICEWTLINKNEKAHAVVADTYGMTSAT
jgi:hypothetical protein